MKLWKMFIHREKPRKRLCRSSVSALFILSILLTSACDYGFTSEQPAYYEVFEVYGSPYERGFQHGQKYESKIRSLYTMLLANSIFPYLNREREDVASVMLRYQDDEIYGDGKFSQLMMLESGRQLLKTIPPQYIEEMHGIADGSGMSFDDILVMNTFFDTLMGFRSITFFIKLIQGPTMLTAEFVGSLETDGADNDGDGLIDESSEGLLEPYEPKLYASWVEIPTDAVLRFTIDDDKEGVDETSIRIQVDEKLYTAVDNPDLIQTKGIAREGKTIEVAFAPPGGWPPASAVAVNIQGYDLNEYVRVAPHHPRSMRDERITFTTAGYGKKIHEVPNRGYPDGRTEPTSLGFAVRGSATKDGGIYLGHNFAMLDSDTTHKHATLFVHHPDEGPDYAFLGYTGLTWGFSGMNTEGVSYLFNTSDTLNNSFAQGFNEGLIFAELLPDGVPAGMMGREILARSSVTEDALGYLAAEQATFGWNFIIVDKSGDMAVAELDGDIFNRPSDGFYTYSTKFDQPGNLDSWGRAWASVGPDDIRASSNYIKNVEEIDYQIATFNIQPQRYWSSFFFRSLKAFWTLGDVIEDNYGQIDFSEMASILRHNELEDQRDGMQSAIYQPAKLLIHVAAGQVPPSDGPYEEFDLGASAAKGGAQ